MTGDGLAYAADASMHVPQTRNWTLSELHASPGPELRVGLVGRGIQQSRTPRMHEAEAARLGFRYSYGLLDFDRMRLDDSALSDVVGLAGRNGFIGLNVTYPFKQAVLPRLDALSPNAAAIGAVNTIVLREGQAIGHNTDCWGFAESFRRGMQDASLGSVLQLGAGGAGMAVGRALLELGTERLGIFDTDHRRAVSLAVALNDQFGAGRAAAVAPIEAAIGQVDGLVNATPVGMAAHPGMPVPGEALHPDMWVADIVYFPEETDLLRAARSRGCRTLSGAGMAVFQAVRAFELFTGIVPDAAEMARHVSS
jgi:shikimate dehydrogenase